MKRMRYAPAAVCLVFALWLVPPLHAQRPGQYTPLRGPLSPYFGFFQFNTTPLPNFQAFVQPRQEVVAGLRNESRRIDTIEKQLRVRGTDSEGRLLRTSESDVGAPSRAADFLNVQPYYPLQRSIRTRR